MGDKRRPPRQGGTGRKDRPVERDILCVLTDGALLLCILLGLVLSALSAYRVEADRGPVLAACLAAAPAALILFSLPRRRWVPLLVLGLGTAAAAWRMGASLKLGGRALSVQIYNTVAEGVWFLEPMATSIRFTSQTVRQGTTEALVLAAVVLALLLGWTVVRRHSPWLTLAVDLAVLLPALCAEILPAWVPFLAVLAGWAALFLGALSKKNAPRESARLRAAALPAAALVLGALTLILPGETYVRPAWADRARTGLETLGQQIDQRYPDGLAGIGGSASGSAERIDLAAAGPRRYSGRTVLQVETEEAGKFYLRGHSAAVYTGTSWELLDGAVYETWAADSGYDFSGDGQTFYFPARTDPGQETHTITVTNLTDSGSCVYLPYFLAPAWEESLEDWFWYDSYLAAGERGWSVSLEYQGETLSQGRAERLTGETAQAEEKYRAFVYEHYTQVPDGFEETRSQWEDSLPSELVGAERTGEAVSGFPAPYQPILAAAMEIAGQLAAAAQYDAETPLTPAGEDFVDWFLNGSRRGYCMHYASAAVLLLRDRGIPARYVSGFTVQTEQPGRADVRDSDAHAWVEVYLDGFGWYPVEVTPGGGGAAAGGEETQAPEEDAETPPAEEPSDPPAETEEAEESAPSDRETAPPAGTGGEGQAAGGPDLTWLIPLGAGLGLCLLALLHRVAARALRERRFRAGDAGRGVIAAYRYLRRLVPWGGVVPQSVEALAEKAAFGPHALTEEERRGVLVCLYREARRVDQALPWWKRLVFRYVLALD